MVKKLLHRITKMVLRIIISAHRATRPLRAREYRSVKNIAAVREKESRHLNWLSRARTGHFCDYITSNYDKKLSPHAYNIQLTQ